MPFGEKDFAKLTSTGFRFGVNDLKEIAKTFRQFADDLENGHVFVQEVECTGLVKRDDYLMRRITIHWVDREHMQGEDHSG